MRGEIAFFSKKKKNGAIDCNGQLYYFHKSDHEELEFKEGEKVEFEKKSAITQETTNRVFFATNVERVKWLKLKEIDLLKLKILGG